MVYFSDPHTFCKLVARFRCLIGLGGGYLFWVWGFLFVCFGKAGVGRVSRTHHRLCCVLHFALYQEA